MEGYKSCPVRCGDDGSLVVLWVDGLNCEEIILPASVLVDMGLFDEASPRFDSYEADSQHAAELLEMKLNIEGFAIEPGCDLYKPVATICSPGPPLERQPEVRIRKMEYDKMADDLA